MTKSGLDHEEFQDLIGPYALNAVDEGERKEVEQHLGACARCREELAAHLETAANLVAPEMAPEHLWEKIESALEAPDFPRFDLSSTRNDVFIGRRRKIAIAVGSVAAVAIAVLSVNVVSQGQRIDELTQTVAAQSLETTAQAASIHPQARKVLLRSPDDARLAAKLLLLPDGRGYLVDDNLAALGEEQIYQLWALIGDQKISAGVLGSDPGVAAFMIAGPVDGFAITAERGPVGSPTTNPIVLGFLNEA